MIEHAGITTVGPVRSKNDDYIAHEIPEDAAVAARKGSLFVIADGVGSGRIGDVASREATQALIQSYYSSSKQPDAALREGFHHANHHVFDLAHTSGGFQRMETTLTGFALVGSRIYMCHVGDSRLYQVRADTKKMRQLTLDHSKVAEMVRMGTITAEEARRHPMRSTITRSVGGDIAVLPQSRSDIASVGDIFVLCTDGVWEPVSDADIAAVVQEHSAEEACRLLIDMAIERDSTDNLSVQVVKVLELDGDSESGSSASGKPSLMSRVIGMFGSFVRPVSDGGGADSSQDPRLSSPVDRLLLSQ